MSTKKNSFDPHSLFFHPSNSVHENADIISLKMRTNAVNVVFFLLALALGLAMAQLPVSWLEMRRGFFGC